MYKGLHRYKFALETANTIVVNSMKDYEKSALFEKLWPHTLAARKVQAEQMVMIREGASSEITNDSVTNFVSSDYFLLKVTRWLLLQFHATLVLSFWRLNQDDFAYLLIQYGEKVWHRQKAKWILIKLSLTYYEALLVKQFLPKKIL